MSAIARGFTLVEVLVATAVFAVAGGLAYGGLQGVLAGTHRLAPAYRHLDALRAGFALLESDLGQALPRAVRDELGDREPAFAGGGTDDVLLFTRYAPSVSLSRDGDAALRRVAYRHADGKLLRRVWPSLDRAPGSEAGEQVLLEDVSAARVRFYDGGWQPLWPAAGGASASGGLPAAVELTLEFHDGDAVRRVLLTGAGP